MGADGGQSYQLEHAVNPDPALLHWADFDWYAAHLCVPVRVTGRTITYAAADPIATRAALTAKERRPFHLTNMPRQEIIDLLNARFHVQLTDHAVSALVRLDPVRSAASGLTFVQGASGIALFVLLALAALIDSAATARLVNLVMLGIFTLLLAFRILILCQREKAPPGHCAHPCAPLKSALPVYTILVPMFDEADMVDDLIDALSRLTYPREKLDIKLILEKSDHTTIRKVARNKCPLPYEIILVPPSLPKTKPKACNYALKFARGDYLVIYDAEDRPEADQLITAMDAFRGAPQDLVCLQAPLSFYNPDQNWLTRQFTIEYAVWFRVVLPALQRLNLPIPLGGTSNHFRADVLKKIGAWDPYNVTEDADLGMRIARSGGACGIINSTTYEEANSQLGNWIRQRSRWQKGFCQTWTVHMRAPGNLISGLGIKGFCGFQLVIGGSIMAGLGALLSLFFIAFHMLKQGPSIPLQQMSVLQAINLALFALCLGVTAVAAFKGLTRTGFRSLSAGILAMPLYWLLVSLAACKGMWQLIANPFYWEKTRHGLTPPHRAKARHPARLDQPYAISRKSSPQYFEERSATIRPPIAE